ncbi:MAG TPA: ribosome-associated translation inhibitor RaiA [Verrucomicrobia bacterium]|nr:ribosome-associated translation inhibitor RaiA [Verrucomicrobiota bacterium]
MMSIEVTVRHLDGAPGAKKYAEERAAKLMEMFPRVEHVHVILNVEKHRCIAEVVVQAKNHIHVEADETSDSLGNSMDVAFDRAEKQLRKLREKIQDHRVKPGEIEELKGL